jgi:fission process protein 1
VREHELITVTAAYGVSWAYLIGDVSFTTYKSSQLGPSPLEAANMSEPTRLSMVAVKRSVFQGLASMALPAFTIHTAVRQATKRLATSPNPALKRWGPTAVGLGIVPALPYLFDEPVRYFPYRRRKKGLTCRSNMW